MNTHEGLHRIKLLGQRIILFGTILAVIFWLLTWFFLRGNGVGSPGIFELFFLVINPLVLGGAILVIAWVVEGFTKDEGKAP